MIVFAIRDKATKYLYDPHHNTLSQTFSTKAHVLSELSMNKVDTAWREKLEIVEVELVEIGVHSAS